MLGRAPADEHDLAKWAGLPLRDIRVGLRAIAPLLASRPDGLLALARRHPAAKLPAPRLLGAFDPLLLGWRSREALLGPHKSLIASNGRFMPFALVRGRAAATWSMPRGEVALKPFTRLTRRDAAALAVDAEDVVRYLGGKRVP